jgi:acyl carrier protein
MKEPMPDSTRPDIPEDLAALLREVLQVDEIDLDRPIAELGIDSLTAAEFSAAVEDEFGVIVPMERFLGTETLRELAVEHGVGTAQAAEQAERA